MKLFWISGSIVVALLFVCMSCLPDQGGISKEEQMAKDDATISSYLSSHGLTATKSDAGIYKVDSAAGSGAMAVDSDITEIDFQMRTLDGDLIVDDSIYTFMPANGFVLARVGFNLEGMRLSVMQLTEGEVAHFFIPSVLMFGVASGFYGDTFINPYEIIRATIRLTAIRDQEKQAAHEDTLIATILDEASVTATQLEGGVYKIIETEGDGIAQPDENASVTFDYATYLLDSTLIDTQTNLVIKLSKLVPGLSTGMQSMKLGEASTFFIPSDQAYGSTGTFTDKHLVVVPSYSPLRIKVTLDAF